MLQDDPGLGQSFGPGCADVVLTNHLQHAGPDVPCDTSGQNQGEGEGRENQMMDPILEQGPGAQKIRSRALGPRWRKAERPIPQAPRPKAENEDQHESQPKRRHGVEEEGDSCEDRIQEGSLFHRLENPHQNPDEESKKESSGCEDKGVWEGRQNPIPHGHLVEVGVAEITLKEGQKPSPVPNQKGIVQPHAATDMLQGFRGHSRPDVDRRRIPGSQAQY